MSLLARRALPLARQMPATVRSNAPMQVRNVHIENTVETAVPFPSGPKNKVGVAIGLTTFMVGGFSLPFLAAWFQIAKAG